MAVMAIVAVVQLCDGNCGGGAAGGVNDVYKSDDVVHGDIVFVNQSSLSKTSTLTFNHGHDIL